MMLKEEEPSVPSAVPPPSSSSSNVSIGAEDIQAKLQYLEQEELREAFPTNYGKTADSGKSGQSIVRYDEEAAL